MVLNVVRWLPIIGLIIAAAAFEPLRSGFQIADQSCEFLPTATQLQSAFFNAKHMVGYGVICFTLAMTLRQHALPIAMIATLLFSALLELQQTFLVTGHCRLWDMVPNLLGVGLAAIFVLLLRFIRASRNSGSHSVEREAD